MSYRRALLFRWSSRDVLAVFALAVIVAFLTGSAVFFTAAAEKPTDIAREFEPIGEVRTFDTVEVASAAADEEALVLPFAELSERRSLVIGVGEAARRQGSQFGIGLPRAPDRGVAREGTGTPGMVTLRTTITERTVRATSLADSGAVPARWYVARPEFVADLGPSGALVVAPYSSVGTDHGNEQESETPTAESQSVVRGTLLFFERGTDQMLQGFVVLVIAAGVLGAVTVGSVVRMTVRDRRETIEVVRATGGTALSVVGLFAVRGVLLTAAAIALGYAIGLVLSSLVTSVAVFAGLPTTLEARIDAETARLLALVYAPVLVVGGVAGVLAALPVVRRPPAGDGGGMSDRNGAAWRQLIASIPGKRMISTRLLDWRAVFPTAATVAVFVALVLLVSAAGVVAEPLGSESSATVVEPGATHPLSSQIPETYADGFASREVSASPEILLFGIVEDQPTIVRGAEYDRFAAVTDATLVDGRRPANTGEALVGADLARTLGISVGETVVVGSGTGQTVERVTIVGRYRASGAYDDQLLISLESGRHLTGIGSGQVNFVRLSESAGSDFERGVQVAAIGVTGTPTTDGVPAAVTVVNTDERNRTRELTVSLGEAEVVRKVTLRPGGQRTIQVQFVPNRSGNYTLSAGSLTRTVSVRDPAELRVMGLPKRAPPDSRPQIRVTRLSGAPAANATVTVGNQTRRTDDRGYVRIPTGEAGTVTVQASDGTSVANRSLTVAQDADRELRVTLGVGPQPVEAFARPSAQVRLYNPWNRTARGIVAIRGPEDRTSWEYALEPGGTAGFGADLSRLPAGEYGITATVNGTVAAETTYEVGGSDRLSTVLARNTETTTGGGLGGAVSVAFGNLTVIAGALVALAGVMTAGTLIASFARSIHARRRTLGIHRATGAGPVRLLWTVLGDAVRIGGVSVVLGVALGAALVKGLAGLDLLVFFGIRITPTLGPGTVLAVSVASLVLVVAGALVPTAAALRRAPAASFRSVNHPQGAERHE